MRMLLQAIGIIWAVIGLANIWQSPVMNPSSKPEALTGFVLLFNVLLFVLPGLLLAGVGSLIKAKDGTKKCPRCAEDIKKDAIVCRFCGAEAEKA